MTVKVKRKVSTKKNSIIVKSEANVPISSLNHYYENARRGNLEKIAESMRSNGQFRSIVVNIGTKTGRPREVLAGNHTMKAAIKLKWLTLDVDWVDVDEAKARSINLADNGSNDDSTYDDALLSKLLSKQKEEAGTLVGTTYSDDVLKKLVKDVDTDPNSKIDRIEDASAEDGSVFTFDDMVKFSSSQNFDIPELLPEMIPDELPQPLDVWAGHELDLPRQEEDPSIWWLAQWHAGMRGVNWKQCIAMFYTEDFHFEPVFTHPTLNAKKILNLGMQYAIMPNFSVNPDWPIATWIWAAYRSFFVGRFWQEVGIKVIPDIQYGTDDMALDITLLGIPQDAGVVACQVQNARGDKNKIRTSARLIKEAEDRLHFKSILVYGFTDADEVVERAGLDATVIRVANRSARRREYLNSGATINTQKVTVKRKKKKVT